MRPEAAFTRSAATASRVYDHFSDLPESEGVQMLGWKQSDVVFEPEKLSRYEFMQQTATKSQYWANLANEYSIKHNLVARHVPALARRRSPMR